MPRPDLVLFENPKSIETQKKNRKKKGQMVWSPQTKKTWNGYCHRKAKNRITAKEKDAHLT